MAEAFPVTRDSIVAAVRSDDRETKSRAYGALVEAYWRPVYKYLRLTRGVADEDARDLTQEFFARAMEKSLFDGYDARRALFRTFLRVCLDRFVANHRASSRRLKRGGGAAVLPLDFEDAEGELRRHDPPDPSSSPDELFHREWVRSIFALAVSDLEAWCEAEGKRTHFLLFERYDLVDAEPHERPTYAELASELGIPVTQVTNYLAAARREFRRAVLARLRETSGGEEEFRAEARALLGVEIA